MECAHGAGSERAADERAATFYTPRTYPRFTWMLAALTIDISADYRCLWATG